MNPDRPRGVTPRKSGAFDGIAPRAPKLRLGAAAVAVIMFSGCASLPQGTLRDPRDPFERVNRAVWNFNDTVDQMVLKPAAEFYEWALPPFVRDMVGNVFANVGDFVSAANHLLQGKPKQSAEHLARFTFNSTVGFFGAIDLATPMGFERQREDFGQTLGRWGMGPGPYMVLPLLGPSSVRDTAGFVVDINTDPLYQVLGAAPNGAVSGLRVIHTRASLLDSEKTLRGIALDRYTLIRDAYLARRRNLVYDGDPPDEPETKDNE